MKFIRIMAIATFSGFILCALSACVTETTNPVFNVERSDKDALADYLKLSVGYLDQGDLTNAKRHLNNAAAIDSNNSEIYGIWGLIYSREGEFELADQSFRRSLRIDSGNSKSRNNYAAFLFARGRYQDAYDQLKRVVADTEYEARPQAFENLGLAALRLNLMEEAEQAFSRALQLNPNQLRSSLELTELNLRKQDVLQARAYYRNFLTLSQFYNRGQNARSLWVGVQLELALGNEDNAREYGALLESNFRNTPEYELYRQAIQ